MTPYSGVKYLCVAASAVIFVVIPCPAIAACQHGWEGFGGHCYKFFPKRMGIRNYLARCRKLGARVLEIQSEMENTFLTNFLKRHGSGGDVWLGIEVEHSTGKWRSLNNGHYILYTNWSKGQPSHTFHFVYGREHCAVMWSDGTWNDVWCFFLAPRYYGVCRKPEKPTDPKKMTTQPGENVSGDRVFRELKFPLVNILQGKNNVVGIVLHRVSCIAET